MDAAVPSLWNTIQAPDSITLHTYAQWEQSSDAMHITAPADITLSFDWAGNGNPQCPISWQVNGVHTQLNALGKSSGRFLFSVNKGDVFGFEIGLISDGPDADGSVTISNFSATTLIVKGFSGPYHILKWTEEADAPVPTLWDVSQVPQSVTLSTCVRCRQSSDAMYIEAHADVTVSFNWTGTGNPNCPIGYHINGVHTQLNTLGQNSGESSFSVNKGDVFGFEVGLTLNESNRGFKAIISNFSVIVQ